MNKIAKMALLAAVVTVLLTGCGGDSTLSPATVSESTPSPTAAPTPLLPPAGQEAGDTWTRSRDGMVMVYVPAGEFSMGTAEADLDAALEQCVYHHGSDACAPDLLEDETPQHTVYLDAYWIDRTEVSVGMFRAFVQATNYETTAEREGEGRVWVEEKAEWQLVPGADWEHPGGPDTKALDGHPVVQVSWEDAAAYCQWVGGRLPTEAEWEKAARGPSSSLFPWGDEFDGTRLNYCDANCPYEGRDTQYDDGYRTTAPVGSHPQGASWCGALNLSGNVSEWVLDWHLGNYYLVSPNRNPGGPSDGLYKVLRGGGWLEGRFYSRIAPHGFGGPQGAHSAALGFRCVISTSTLVFNPF